MNPFLKKLQPYPFQRLNELKAGISPPAQLSHLAMSIGEPKHAAPEFIASALEDNLQHLSTYPTTRGTDTLRETIAAWLVNRFRLQAAGVDPATQVLPVNGTREALFAFAQAVIDSADPARVVMPNPFYQIYEGACLLAGAEPWYVNPVSEQDQLPDFGSISDAVWSSCQLLYLCSPGNPTGAVVPQSTLERLIELADRHDFVIAADECYSEIYFDEDQPPVGLLSAAANMGRDGYERCVVFHSLSKRSNVPGLRSGFVAGDASIIETFFQYRTYHGCAMPVHTQIASQAAWADETHVIENRRLYTEKFEAVLNILGDCLPVDQPAAAFYLWPQTPVDDTVFAQRLFAQQNITVLPGSFLSRTVQGRNPGANRIRMALVPTLDECIDAAQRIRSFCDTL
ncbi:MAG TPA: succinyldiaminopimelate transaminase [Chromatiaceae bacterium]|nr:succinyldiaminopimelate transaminase [Chromatiaceae bacterium]